MKQLPQQFTRKSVDTILAKRWQRVIAEFLGSVFFIYAVSSSVVIPLAYLGANPGVAALVTAFIQGLALVAVISIFSGISGCHVNPAITLTCIFIRRISIVVGVLYVLAQLLGAIVGAALFRASVYDWREGSLSATTVGPGVSIGQAFLIEFMITSLLLFVVVSTSNDSRKGLYILSPIPIGFSVIVGVLIAKTLTGASMNPARSFGPAVVAGVWTNHWLYWVAPLTSALFVSLVYEIIMHSTFTTAANVNPVNTLPVTQAPNSTEQIIQMPL